MQRVSILRPGNIDHVRPAGEWPTLEVIRLSSKIPFARNDVIKRCVASLNAFAQYVKLDFVNTQKHAHISVVKPKITIRTGRAALAKDTRLRKTSYGATWFLSAITIPVKNAISEAGGYRRITLKVTQAIPSFGWILTMGLRCALNAIPELKTTASERQIRQGQRNGDGQYELIPNFTVLVTLGGTLTTRR